MRERSATRAWLCCLAAILLATRGAGGQNAGSTIEPLEDETAAAPAAPGTNVPTFQTVQQPTIQAGEPVAPGVTQPLPPVGPTQVPAVQTLPDDPGIVFPSGVLLESCDPTDPDGDKCRPGSICAPDSTSSNSSAGLCALPPIGGVVLPIPKGEKTVKTVPVAYYSLATNAFRSWPSTVISGTSTNVTFRHDPEFGSVLHCKQDARDVVVLDNVKYGTTGAFSINIWMKKDISTDFFGDTFQFIFSHSSLDGANAAQFTPTTPNQVQIYLPEASHPAHGLVRAIVQDSTDTKSSLEDKNFPYLDSDGSYRNDDPRNVTDHVELEDGQWHMITVTSNPDSKGYRIYIDGELAGVTPKSKDASGGDPLDIDGRIFLCGRIDNNPARHFDGSLAKLSIYDEALSPDYIQAMYTLTVEATETREVLAPSEDDEEDSDRSQPIKTVEDAASGLKFVRLHEIDSALGRLEFEGADIQEPLKINLTELAQDVNLCVVDPESTGVKDDSCSKGEVCAPLHNRILRLFVSKSELEDEEKFFKDGACALEPDGGLVMPGPDNELPVPMAFFPLTGGSVKAWPAENAQGFAVNAEIVEDDAFGDVFHCTQEEGSFIVLDNVPYGEKGAFAINMWFRASNLTGSAFQYMFSHSGVMPTLNSWKENQVQIYLAEKEHSAAGVVRVILKDSDDNVRGPQGQIYLDSDGDVGTTVKTEDSGPHIDIGDQQWHMVTVSTRPDRKDGFSLYLDGELAGEVVEGEVYTGNDGIPKYPTGGNMMRPGGKIYLCGRHDGNQARHFDGELAQLALFDSPLEADEVATLYDFAVKGRPIVSKKIILTRDPSSLGPSAEFVETNPLEPRDVTDTNNSPATSNLPKGSWIGDIVGSARERYGSCDIDSYVEDLCENGLECVPIVTPAPPPNPELRLERAGMCVTVPPRGAYVFDVKNEIEPPVAYFPLTEALMNSWPFPSFTGGASADLSFADDTVFGRVLDCREASMDQVVLDPVDYGAKGTFTINFWVRKKEYHKNDGRGFQFVFSHNGPEGYQNLTQPSQVQVYFPEESHHLYGIVRAVVRDADDTGDEAAYLDSDGYYSTNDERSLPDDMVNFTDGKWHMITLTTFEEKPGYALYVDGILQADSSNPVEKSTVEVTGGDPTGINGPIYLCGRSDGMPDRHFDGNIAHLAIWNSVLTQQEIFVLYERFVMISTGTQVAHPDRTAVDGQACLFPGLLRGELVIDCADIDGVLQCPVRDGSWMECAPFEETSIAYNPATVAERYTVDGEKCIFPDTYNGRTVNDCIVLEGMQSRCRTDKTTGWKQCAERVVRYTVDGGVCELPFELEGKTYTDCTIVDGLEQCLANGSMVECSPRTILDETDSIMSERPPPISLSGGRVVSRVTVDGDACVFPFWHQGKSVAQCVDVDGTQQCQVSSGDLKECADMVYTRTGTPCAFPFADETDPMKSISSCVEKNGVDMCKNPEGVWEECSDGVGYTNENTVLLPGRVTSDNEECGFPFWFKGRLVSTCVDETGSSSFVTGSCRTKSGNFAKCAPVKATVTGNLCSIPFSYEGEVHYDCIRVDDADRCMVPNGQWEECAPDSTVSEESQTPAVRITVNGDQCVLPFLYNGETRFDCVSVDGVESCKDSSNTWQECIPVGSIQFVKRVTVNGDACDMPFDLNGRLFTDCATIDESSEVCLFEENLVDCAPLTGGRQYATGDFTVLNDRRTSSGETCRFPFTYNGAYYVDCVTVGGAESCKVASGEWEECVPISTGPVRTTVDGDNCVFPLLYEGEELDDCVTIDGFESCKDAAGEWKECMPLSIAPVMRKTVDGDDCAFPLSYNGEELNDCVTIDGVDSCKDATGQWQECAPLTTSPVIRKTVYGDACVFPLLYNGNELNDCVVIDGFESCKDKAGEWQECEPIPHVTRRTSDGSICAFPFLYNGDELNDCVVVDGFESCKDAAGAWHECVPLDIVPVVRQTVKGNACAFPLSYNGEELNDCVTIDGVDSCKDATGEWQECAPLSNAPVMRKTIDGDDCAFPLSYNGEELNDCVTIDGVDSCKDATGQWQECAPAGTALLIRKTLDGATCAFPFSHNGEEHNDCVVIEGFESCKDAAGELHECVPLDIVPVLTRKTVEGEDCAFPLSYNGEELNDCVAIDGTESCKTASGDWGECAPLSNIRATVSGNICEFPFSYLGEEVSNCVELDGRESCKIASGDWEECAKDRSTVTGIQCRFPFSYEGRVMTECVEVNGVESCQSVNGKWEECAAHPPSFQSRKTISGRNCQFPFEFEGEMSDGCVTSGTKEVCLTEEGKMEECEPMARRVAVSGRVCVFPVQYNGDIIEDCVKRNSDKEECVTDVDAKKWEECKPLPAAKDALIGVDESKLLAAESAPSKKKNSKIKKSSVIGIVGGVLGFLVLVVIIALGVFKFRGSKNYEQSGKNFKKFEDDPEHGDNIALSAMGSSNPGGKKSVGFSDAPEHSSS